MTVRTTLKWVISLILYYSGMVWLVRHLGRPAGTILVFHRVRDAWIDDSMSVSRATFEQQIRYVAKVYDVVSLDELGQMLTEGRPLKRGKLAITFDDGFRDNYSAAWPILARHGCPATVFLAVAAIDEGAPMWTEHLRGALEASTTACLDARCLGLGILPLGGEAERRTSLRALNARLKKMPDRERTEGVAEICRRLGSPSELSTTLTGEMLNWDMILKMRAGGISIGAHTISHKILTRMDPSEARWEIEESKRRIEKNVGEPIHHFAYPNGTSHDWNREIQELVRRAGFATACTTVKGTNPKGRDVYALRRLDINDRACTDPWGEFSVAMFAVRLAALL